MTVAFFSFLGVVIGAALQYIFTRHLDSQRHHMELRSKAYLDYLRNASELAQLRSQSSTDEVKQLLARTTDAKSRICLYGSRPTIEAFAKFERLGAVLITDEQLESFTNMVALMRQDSGTRDVAELDDLKTVLMGVRRKHT